MINIDKLEKKYFLSDRPVIVDENTGQTRLILYQIFHPENYEGRTIYTKDKKYYVADNIHNNYGQELQEK